MRLITMIVVAALALLLVNVHFSHSCDGVDQVLICRKIPSYFSPGYLTLLMYLSDVGEINSTVFRSSNLTSVTGLRIDNAGVTAIAEGAFGSFQNLTSVSLRRNALMQINSNWFGRPAVLRELILEENQIEAVNESTLSGFINLTKLSLNKNRIRTIEPNSFRSHTNLAELDLSGNRMTRVSPQVFGALRSARIRLDGNPWDCSCEAEDLVVFLKDLQSRSLLDRPAEVTCESPPSLRGRPVWGASVCVTSPAPGPPSVSQTVPPRPTDAVTTVPVSSAKVVTAPSQETSVQTKPTDAPTHPIISSHTATPPARPTPQMSVRPSATDVLRTVSVQTVTHVTSAAREAETSTPPHTAATETCVTPKLDSNTVYALVVVIVLLCALQAAGCVLASQRRRRRSNKTEGRSTEERPHPDPPEDRDPETAQGGPHAGPRAKSANAILPVSPSAVSGENQATEARSKGTETQAEAQRKQEAGGVQENVTDPERRADARRSPGADPHRVPAGGAGPHRVPAGADTAPYLSIGANRSRHSPDSLHKQRSKGQRSPMGKVMGRISTWPPTAIQWQARCKMMEEEEEEEEGEREKTVNEQEHPSVSDKAEGGGEVEETQMEDLTTRDPPEMNPAGMKLNFSEAQAQTDIKREEPASARQTGTKTQSQDPGTVNPAEHPAHRTPSEGSSSRKPQQRGEAKRAGAGRRRAQSRSTGSGGASPDDAALLCGNQFAFIDLLHEVVQNNGRWTRERWRQIHVNQRRREDGGARVIP